MILCSIQIFLISLIDARFFLQVGWQAFVAAGVLAYCPTLIQLFVQNKSFKIAARTLLGESIILLWFGAMVLLPETVVGVVLRGVFISVFFLVMNSTLSFRSRMSRKSPLKCLRGGFPFCRFVIGSDSTDSLPESSPANALITALKIANVPYELVACDQVCEETPLSCRQNDS